MKWRTQIGLLALDQAIPYLYEMKKTKITSVDSAIAPESAWCAMRLS